MVNLRQVVLAAALALTFLGDAWGQSRQPPRPPQPSTQPAPTPAAPPDQRGTEQAPLSVKILPDPEAKEKDEQERKQRAAVEEKLLLETERIAEYVRWLSASALGLFFVALGLVALFGLQMRQARRGTEESANATKAAMESARAASAQAGIARDSFKAMQSSAERQSRAYVEVAIEKLDLNANAGTAEVVLRVRNVGQTPARDLACSSWVDLRPWPQPPNATFAGPADPNPPPKVILNPGQARHFKAAAKTALKKFELEEIAAGTPRRLYVFGSVTYRDVFKNDLVTEFCVALKAAPGEPFDVAYLPQHNNAT